MKKFAEVNGNRVILIRECADDHSPKAVLPVRFIILTEDEASIIKPGWEYLDGIFIAPQEPDTESIKRMNISMLWEAAHAYEYAQISGSATGMLALGVLGQKPKSLAVSSWIQSIWDMYYSRKPLITHIQDSSMYDFSPCGPMPYSVPELMQEILGE